MKSDQKLINNCLFFIRDRVMLTQDENSYVQYMQ